MKRNRLCWSWTSFVACFSVFLMIFFISKSPCNANEEEDLYNVLGVSRTATTKEIKKAYKAQVRIWHPDKNKQPGASEKFSKIYEAYKTLSDSEKRSLYDRHGYAAIREQQQNPNGRGGFGDFPGFFRNGPFGSFSFNFGGESIVDKYTISLQFYEKQVLPDSYRKPFFLYAYADLCFACMHYEPLMEKLFKELEEVGIGFGTVHVSSSRALGSRLRIHEIPMIMAVINGRVTYFKGQVSLQTLRDFIRNLFPNDVVQYLHDDNLNDFLTGWSDNRVRALFFSAREKPPVRFLLPAFGHRQKIATGFVSTKSSSQVSAILRRYNINRSKDTLIIVAEESNASIAIVTMQSLSKGSIEEVMEANQYLMLPRLSSQTFFDDLCPAESHIKHRKFCVILVTKKTTDHDKHRSSFRLYAQQAPTFHDRVRFTYIYKDTQHQFVDALLNGNSSSEPDESSLKITILWRVDKKRMDYEWVEPGWSLDSQLNALTRHNLEKRLQQLFTNTDRLLHTAMLPNLYNEHTLGGIMGLVMRLSAKFNDWCDYLVVTVSNMDFFIWSFLLLALATLFCFGILSLQQIFGDGIEQKSSQRRPASSSQQRCARPSSINKDNSLCIYELSNKSYNYLVKCVEGGLTVTLLVDQRLQDKLLEVFTSAVRPYASSHTLTFGYLLLDKYIGWYRQVLENSEGLRVQPSKFSIQNCVGTILAINGYRQYYYIFHSKCPQKWTQKVNCSHGEGLFDSGSNSEDEEEEEAPCLLEGLENWMDKIFDGMVQKIRVSHWPEMNLPSIPL